MKVYINEDKISLLKESQDELTFYGFFTQVKNFMKELLKGNVTAEPSQVLKSHGLGQKELISRLKKKGLLTSDENIDEVPNEDNETKLRARHTIKYSVPKRDFEKKFHRLYSELFESEWKPKSVLSNEKEEIQKILDNDTDGAYRNRGGYKIQENSSQIGVYYHGGDLNDDIWYSKVLWLTPQDYYAKEYAKQQEHTKPVIYEVKIDESKLNICSIYHFSDNFDPYEGPNDEELQECLEEGINGYWMDYDSYNAEGLCLFIKDPIISVRQLSQEEFDAIEDWDEELNESVNLQENYFNEDYPLYHFTSLDNLEEIAKGGYILSSRINDNEEAICFTRSKNEIDYDGINGSRRMRAIITISPNKLSLPRSLKLVPFQCHFQGIEDEFEERIVRKQPNYMNWDEDFSVSIKNAIERIDIYVPIHDSFLGMCSTLKNIINYSQDLYTKLYFYTTPLGFINHRNSYNPKEIMMYLADFMNGGYEPTRREWKYDGLYRANEIDNEEKEVEEERQKVEMGKYYVDMLKKIMVEFHSKLGLFTEIPDMKEQPVQNMLYTLYKWGDFIKVYRYLNALHKDSEYGKVYDAISGNVLFQNKSIEERIANFFMYASYKTKKN